MNVNSPTRELSGLALQQHDRQSNLMFFPEERQIVVHSILEGLLGEDDVVIARGAPLVGKTTIVDILHGRLVGLRFRVVRPAAGRHGPLDLHRMIGEGFGIERADRMAPAELVDAVDSVTTGTVVAVLIDDAHRSSAALFHYLSLVRILLNRERKRLCLVFVGTTGRWNGLEPDYLATLRRAARNYVVPEFSPGQAADYLQATLAAAGVAPRQLLKRRILGKRAATDLLEEAGGVPGRIEALAQAAVDRRRQLSPPAERRRNWRYPALAGAAAAAVAAAFLLRAELPALTARFAPASKPEAAALSAEPAVATLEPARLPPSPVAIASDGAPPALPVAPAPVSPVAPAPVLPVVPAELPSLSGAPTPPPARPDALLAMTVSPPAPSPAPGPDPAGSRADQAAVASTSAALPQAGPSTDATVTVTPNVPSPAPAAAPAPAAEAEARSATPPAAVPATQPPAAVTAQEEPPQDSVEPEDRQRPQPTAGNATISPRSITSAAANVRGGPGLALVVRPGDTIASLYLKVYRGVTAPPFAEVAAVNRLPLKPGGIVIFPTPPDGWTMR